MITVALVVLGLCLGSFVNALVWRLHEQAEKGRLKELSILKGRSQCPNCHHQLAAKDLIPLLSWLSLGGKCRYCSKPISWQYPLVELGTALLFVGSYAFWPKTLTGAQIAIFILWLPLLTGLVALIVYDWRWKLLPNRIIYPLGLIAVVQAVISVSTSSKPLTALIDTILAVAIGGGVFYILFLLSNGKWIGGGDIRLGWLLGLIVGTPAKAVLVIFLASVLGSLVSLPLLASKRLQRTSTIAFGPFLIVAGFITVLFGTSILNWYQRIFMIN